VEHQSERNKHQTMLVQFLRTGRGIAFSQMFAMREYPSDVMPLYAQGYSTAEFLIETGGRRKYVEFLGDGLKTEDWPGAIRRHYGIADLGQLQNTWLAWVKQGSPPIKTEEAAAVAAASAEAIAAAPRRPRPAPNLIYREPKTLPALASAASMPQSEPQTLPASGWHAAGASAPRAATAPIASSGREPMSDPFRAQVTRPQPIETPGQTALGGVLR
jgi:hypothetical protein